MNTEPSQEASQTPIVPAPQNVEPVTPQQSTLPAYVSNPFTIGLDGISRMFKYAQAVAITILVLGLLGGLGNTGAGNSRSTLPASNNNSSSSSDTTSSFKSTDSGDSTSSFIQQVKTKEKETISPVLIMAIVAGVLFAILLGLVIGSLVSAAFAGVYAAAGNAAADGVKISFSEAFNQMGSRYKQLYVANLLVSLKVIGGFLLFVVPGVRAALRYSAVNNILLKEKELTAIQAIAKAKSLYAGHLLEVFGINTVGSILPAAGQVLTVGGIALSYKQISAYKTANLKTPETHWLNYLGFLLMGLILMAIAMIAFLVITVIAVNK